MSKPIRSIWIRSKPDYCKMKIAGIFLRFTRGGQASSKNRDIRVKIYLASTLEILSVVTIASINWAVIYLVLTRLPLP